MGLVIDDEACLVLGQRGRGKAVRILLVSSYALGVAGLSVEWCRASQADHDCSLMYLETRQGVPIYGEQRVAAYLHWHSLCLSAWSRVWWQGLSIRHTDQVVRDLVRWERRHPGLCCGSGDGMLAR